MNIFCNLSAYTSKILNFHLYLPRGRLLFSYLKKLAYPHQFDFEGSHHAHLSAFLFLSSFLQLIDINAEILLQFVIQDAEIII